MNRRDALRSTAFLIGSASTFTSLGVLTQGCSPGIENDWTTLSNMYVQQLLAEVAGTIIPQTETPGAKEVNVQLYITKMLQDCEEQEIQNDFLAGMKQLDERCKELHGNTFAECEPLQREEVLNGIAELPDDAPADGQSPDFSKLKSFMKTMKRYTVRGYLNSEYYMTEVKKYELIPGRFNGCMPVEELPNV